MFTDKNTLIKLSGLTLFLSGILLLLFVNTALAEPTPNINYQGKLTDASGVAVPDGAYNMWFFLYSTTGGATTTNIWEEQLVGANQVQVIDGLFSVMLGSTSALTSVNFNQPLYLGVEIGGTGAPSWDGEMLPRKALGTVPAAFESYQLGGVASSSFLRSDEADTLAATTASTLLTITQSGTGDILNLFDGGTEVFTVIDGGQVGIGTNAPSGALEVVGDIVSKGTSWTTHAAAGNDDGWRGLAYGNGTFVAVGYTGTDLVMTSPDGINWATTTAAGNDDSWYGVTYGNGLFVAVGSSGDDRVITSPDGITWTARSAVGNDDGWEKVTYGNGLFVAVGDGGDKVMTSPDGITWTARSAAGNNDGWQDVTYGNGLFVAVSNSNDRVMTSPDGITWTVQSAAGDDDFWQGVTYSNGLFVAVGDSGDKVMTSPDGITWTARSAAGDDDSWQGITYGNGLFVAVGSSGDRVMTSPDGITWTARSVSNNWYAVTYGNGHFVAVSSSGDRAMTSGRPETSPFARNNIYQGGMSIFGNVGIGTTSPYAKLSVTGTTGQTNPLFTVASSSDESVFVITSEGDVGIGTNSPGRPLDVYKPGGATVIARIRNDASRAELGVTNSAAYINSGNSKDLKFEINGGAVLTVNGGTTNIGIGTTSPYAKLSITGDVGQTNPLFTIASSTNQSLLTVSSAGNVGIGTTSPTTLLTVGSSTPTALLAGELYNSAYVAGSLEVAGNIYGTISPDTITLAQGNLLVGDATGNAVATSSLFVNAIGQVGIGTASPDKNLHIESGAVGENVDLRLHHTGVGGGDWTLFSHRDGHFGVFDGDASVNRLVIDSAGNIGIGTTTPDSLLHLVTNEPHSQMIHLDNMAGNGSSSIRFSEGGASYLDIFYDGTRNVLGYAGNGSDRMLFDRNTGRVAYGENIDINDVNNAALTLQQSGADSRLNIVSYTGTYDPYISLGTAQGAAATWSFGLDDDASDNFTISQGDGLGTNDFFSLTTAGYLGLGTTSPLSKLSVLGDLFLEGSNRYINFGSATGSTAYGVRDNGGAIEIKDSNGAWAPYAEVTALTKGINWATTSAAGDNDSWIEVTYGNGLFVAVGDATGSGDAVMTSPDGINWTARLAAGDNDSWNGVTYGNGLFVAVGSSGDRVMTSPDGINWTARLAAGDNDSWSGVTYGNGLFVAVGSSGDDRVITSPDGITWTARSAVGDDDSWQDVTYGNGLFVAVGWLSSDIVMTSPDGINWTARSAVGDDDFWTKVTYGNGLFVAVSAISTDEVMTSPDGITWTTRVSGGGDSWYGIIYAEGLYVAINDSSANSVMTSPDGITWIDRAGTGNNNWFDLTYGNGRFVVVGDSADGGDAVMYSGQPETSSFAHNNIYQGGMSIFGNVGIGTTSPYAELAVVGDAVVTGTTSALSYKANSDQAYFINSTPVITGSTTINSFFFGGSNPTSFDNSAVNNYAIGQSALDSLTTGSHNIAIGDLALTSNTTGLDNIGLGREALEKNISGDNNLALGPYALEENTTGSNNIALGGLSLSFGNTTGSNNVSLGVFSLASNNGTGTIAIGSNAADNASAVDRGIFIGDDIDAFSTTEDDVLNIGNLIFGNNVDGTGTTYSTGNVGIGTSTPYEKLSVVGNVVATGTINTQTDAVNTFAGHLDINGTATSTFANGITLEGGCLNVGGVCLSADGDTNVVVATANSLNKDYADYIVNGTDDEVEIQAAIDSLPTEGGTVYLLEGTYIVSATNAITMADSTRLIGQGGSTIIKLEDNWNANSNIIYANAVQDIYVGQLVIDGNGINQGPASYHGIYLSNTSSSTIEKTHVNDVQDYGIRLLTANYNSIVGNTTNNSGNSGIYLTNSDNNKIINNTASGNNSGLYIFSGSDYNVMTNNISSNNNLRGFNIVSSSKYNTLTGNIADNNGQNGILIQTNADNNIVTSNTLYNNGAAGSYPSIYLNNSDDNLISSNNISATSSNSLIEITSDSNHTIVVGNSYTNPDTSTYITDAASDTLYNEWDRTTLTTDSERGYSLFSIRGSSSVALASSTQLGTGDIFTLNNASGNVLTVANNGNLGVGTSTPWAKLSVNYVDGTDTGPRFLVGSSTETNLIVSSAGHVGIGTTSPGSLLTIDVNGVVNNEHALWLSNINNNDVAIGFATGATTSSIRYDQDSHGFEFRTNGTTGLDTKMYIGDDGDIGIGTVTPNTAFHLRRPDASMQLEATDGTAFSGLNLFDNTGTLAASVQYGNGSSGKANTFFLGSRIAGEPTVFWAGADGTERARIDGTTGYFAIGTTSPTALLTVGSSTPTELLAGDLYNSAYISGLLEVGGAGDNFFAGNVGIGTTSTSLLTISKNDDTASSTLSIHVGASNSASASAILSFRETGAASLHDFGFDTLYDADDNLFSINSVDSSILTPRLTIARQTGEISLLATTTIGDGTTGAQAGIQVGFGGICVDNDGSCVASTTGRITGVEVQTGNSDLAETYFSSNDLESGDIVSLEGNLSIDRANDSDDTIIGVVSTKPGLLLGFDDISLTEGETPYPVALAGRVPVKISTENGPVKKGDTLMLSSLPGVAMKATGVGTTIGIALEDFDDTRMYSDTYINQFTDDLGTTTEEMIEETIETLEETAAETTKVDRHTEVKIGQIVMFVKLGQKWLGDDQLASLDSLLDSSLVETIGENESETIFDRLLVLTDNFVDGILSVFELRADRVEVKEELCVDDVCLTADDLRVLLDETEGSVNVSETNETEDDSEQTENGNDSGSDNSNQDPADNGEGGNDENVTATTTETEVVVEVGGEQATTTANFEVEDVVDTTATTTEEEIIEEVENESVEETEEESEAGEGEESVEEEEVVTKVVVAPEEAGETEDVLESESDTNNE